MPGEKEETGPVCKCRPKGRGRLVYVDRSWHEVSGIRQRPLDDPSPPDASAPAANFINMLEEVSGIFVNPRGTGPLEFFLPIAAGE
jgi:hypothetical protein